MTEKTNSMVRRRLAARRRGMALPMALLIVIIGSALIAAMFELSSVFSRTAVIQRESYVDHITITDYLERAKGFLVNLNYQRHLTGQSVMHGPGNAALSADLHSLADLQLTQDEVWEVLSVDHVVVTKNGRQRVVMQVFDVNYDPERIRMPLIADLDQLERLPPSLMLVIAEDTGLGIWGTGGFSSGRSAPPPVNLNDVLSESFERYGAYFIRVQLFDASRNGRETPSHEVEETFFQTIPK